MRIKIPIEEVTVPDDFPVDKISLKAVIIATDLDIDSTTFFQVAENFWPIDKITALLNSLLAVEGHVYEEEFYNCKLFVLHKILSGILLQLDLTKKMISAEDTLLLKDIMDKLNKLLEKINADIRCLPEIKPN